MRIYTLLALALFSLPTFSHPLVNPVLTYLDDHNVSYIAKVEKSTLVIHVVKGDVNLDEVRQVAKTVDIKVVVRDNLRIK